MGERMMKKYFVYVLVGLLVVGIFTARIFLSKGSLPALKSTAVPADTSETVSWEDAGRYLGKIITVEGTIIASHNTGKVCFLNFHKNYKQYLSLVIFQSDYAKFKAPVENAYLNKKIQVTGMVKEYKGRSEIIVNNPEQIQVME
jgi:DNA/RNA endonuclease YhcR with UshA esterase domain